MSTHTPENKEEYDAKISKVPEEGVEVSDFTTNILDAVKEAVTLANGVIIPIDKFLPLFKDITSVFLNLVDMYQTAQTNKRICGVLLDRVHVADAAIKNLEIRKDDYREFFTEPNLVLLQKLKNIIINIAEYVKEIRELKWLRKYFTSKTISETFKELTAEFDGYMSVLNFTMTIESKMQTKRDHVALSSDIKETHQLLRQLVETVSCEAKPLDGTTKIKDDIADIKDCIHEIIAMLKHFEEFSDMTKLFNGSQNSRSEGGLKKEDFIDSLLNLKDYTFLEEPRGGIRKYVRNSDNHEVAFSEIVILEEQQNLHFEISLLKRLRGSRDVIQFYGLVKDEHLSKTYLVTEWSQHGNLREYYRQRRLEQSSKLQIALDIALGLNFLQAYEILHRDLRSVNIMIGSHGHAKLANFSMSRGFCEASRGISEAFECVRYKAPERINNPDYKYDSKCEVFSFGMLLWEIAETKLPFFDIKNLEISEKILENPIQLLFESDVPEKWKKLVFKAIDHDRSKRPDFKTMLMKLRNLTQEQATTKNPKPTAAQKSYIRNVMSMDEAIKQHKHKRRNGKKYEAWKSFEFYAQLGDTVAKYHKAYYLLHNLLPFPYTEKDRVEQAINLLEEIIDKENMTDAQLLYANCLLQGHGVKRDNELAYKYLREVADKGEAKAMYNIGLMHYEGVGVKRNVEKGIYWIKRAAYNGEPSAFKFCKSNYIYL